MTRDDFVEENVREFEGYLLDVALGGRTGGELSLTLKAYRAKVRARLGVIFDQKLLATPDKGLFPTTKEKAK